MTSWVRMMLRNLWVRKARTVLTVCGIALGVAAILASRVAMESTTAALVSLVAEAGGRATLTVSSAGGSTLRMPPQALEIVRETPGVEVAVPSTSDGALLIGPARDVRVIVMGIDPALDVQLRVYNLAAGAFLSAGDGGYTLVLPQRLAQDQSLSVGEEVKLLTPAGEQHFRLIGFLSDEGAGHLYNGRVAFTRISVAQEIFGHDGRLEQIDVVATSEVAGDKAAVGRLKTDLQTRLGDHYIVTSPGTGAQVFTDMLTSLRTGLSIFGLITLFVATLLIYNTFAMTLAERTREIGLLRTLGLSHTQAAVLVLTEAMLLGLLGSGLGIVVGLLLSFPLIGGLAAWMNTPPSQPYVIPTDLTASVGMGMAATLTAAAIPAWAASRISPIEALRVRGRQGQGWLVCRGWRLGLVILALATVLSVLPGQTLIGLWTLLIFLGAVMAVPAGVGLLEHFLRRPVAVLYGNEGYLGSSNLQRIRERAALTAGVLMVGVVMVIIVIMMAASAGHEMQRWVETAIGGDFYLAREPTRTGSGLPISFDLTEHIARIPGIEAIAPMRYFNGRLIGVTTSSGFQAKDDAVLLRAVRPQDQQRIVGFRFAPGQEEDEETILQEFKRGGAVFVPTPLAQEYHLQRGDTIRLRTIGGYQDFRIAGIIVDFLGVGRIVTIAWADMSIYFGENNADVFIVQLSPGASAQRVKAQLEDKLAREYRLSITEGKQMRASLLAWSRQAFTLFYAIVVIAIIVAALGVTNVMTLNILERTREIGLLRALGMTPMQVGKMVLAEAAVIGAIGGGLGLLLGLPVSMLANRWMNQVSGFSLPYVLPGTIVPTVILTALLVSQVAAFYPVYRALQGDIVHAIRFE